MYNPKLILSNIFKFETFKEYLVCSYIKENNQGTLRIYDKTTLILKYEIDTFFPISYFFEVNNILYAIDIKNQGLKFNEKFEFEYFIKEPFKIPTINLTSEFIVVFRGKIKEREFGVFSLLTNKILWSSRKYRSLEILGETLFSQFDFVFCCLQLNTGELIWELDLKQYFSTSNLSGRIQIFNLINDIVIIGIDKIDKLIAIDIFSGKIIWEISDTTKGKIIKDNIIYGFLINYAEFSLEDGKKIKSFINRDYFEEIGIETQRSNYVLIDNHIITTDWRKGKIGAFNINTFKFDWVYEVDNVSFPSANPIKYSEPYLYLQDNNNTLHIFEKTQNETA